MHHLHTKESITVTFKSNGRYDEAALRQLNWFLRDWRHDTETRMDPRLIDLVWEVNRDVGGSQPIEIICGYRDESTNAMLRRRSNGVAQNSLHMSGKAMDFAIPGVALDKLRAAGLRLQRGGVGFYPSSGSPFVHVDIGGVRHWPRMTREQLVRIFPDGRTVHLPTDGQPLAGYALALADIERRGGSAPGALIATTHETGGEAETTADVAPRRSLLARIFGPNEDLEEPKPVAAPVRARVALAAKTSPVPLPKVRPADAPVVVAMALPAARTIATETAAPASSVHTRPQAVSASASASLSPNEIIRTRGYWVGVPDPMPVGSIGSGDQRLAYAPEPGHHRALAHALQRTVVMRSATTATSIAIKGGVEPPAPLQMFNPWLHAVAITPSVWTYLSSTQYGVRDPRSLRPFLDKPTAAVQMAFSHDPHGSLNAERFSGRAVVFVDTVTLAVRVDRAAARTALLR
jgi:uncharacterized protein YcbK (DUF882 family)